MKYKEDIKEAIKIKEITDAVGDGISIQDARFQILYQNKAQINMIGNHIGEKCYQAYEGKNNICIDCPVLKVFKDGKVHRSERRVTRDGILFYIEITASPLKDSSGDVIAGIEVVRDITEKKKDSENIFNIINDAITIHDADFNIIHANDNANTLLNSNLKSILSQKCFKSYHGTRCPPELCPSCSVLKTGKPASSELFEPHLNKHIEIRAFPRFDRKGKLRGLVHVVRDISARKKMEIELQEAVRKLTVQTEELQESNIAFKHLLKQREMDKRNLAEDVLSNINLLVVPYIEKLKASKMIGEQEAALINIIETNIKNLISSFSHKLSLEYYGLSPSEIKIANLIRDGHQDKDIADIFNISLETVKTHRQNMRKKLSIRGKKTNLMTHLLSLTE